MSKQEELWRPQAKAGRLVSAPKSAAQYTPGPWSVFNYDAGDNELLNGMPSISAPDEIDCGIVHWNGFVQPFWRSARGDREMHANARLIAAAPELLEALVAVSMSAVLIPSNPAECAVSRNVIRQVEDVIAKALGQ